MIEPDETSKIFGYYINLDERGDFRADVRNAAGETVFNILAGTSLEEDETSIFEDGFMRHKNDLDGLTAYLQDLKVIPQGSQILAAVVFERRLQEADENSLRSLSPRPR